MATLFGVAIDGYSAANVQAFERAIGAEVETVLGYGSGSGGWADMNPGWIYSQGFLGGAGKPVNLSMPMAPDSAGVADYASIARGEHRGDHQSWARTILAAAPQDGSPIYVRSTWEIPGEWFPWSQVAKDDPETFKAAWRAFADAFHDVSDRFQMVWDFNSDRGAVEQFYPGDEAVDVIGQDIYWNSDFQGGAPDAAFDKHFAAKGGYSRGLDWMADFAAAHGKPMAISEWGVPINDPAVTAEEAAAWVGRFRDWILDQNNDPGEPGVAYVNYWNVSEAYTYGGRVENDQENAVRQALGNMARALAADTSPAPTPTPTPTPAPTPNPPPNPTPVALVAGSGPDSLVLKISQDAYQGSAQYTVSVDGKQIGGTFIASAWHSAGQSDTLTLKGDWAAGAHKVEVKFLNDAYGGTAATDRNLYVDGATYNGAAVSGAAKALLSAGPASFSFTDNAAGNLTLQGTAGADSLTGGAGADRLLGLAGNDTLNGGGGDDALNGAAGADKLNGGAGIDYLVGGAGADLLAGGAGADRFAFLALGERGDTISDFKASEGDRLDLRGLFGGTGQKYAELSSKGFVKAAAVSGGMQVSVDADGGGNGYVALVTLQGLTVAALDGDFLIA
jgi:Ca2+-binding RTX toxin-like protein